MHEECRLRVEVKHRLGRQHVVCSHLCEVQVKMDLSTEQLLEHVQRIALHLDLIRDGSLLKTDIADLKMLK